MIIIIIITIHSATRVMFFTFRKSYQRFWSRLTTFKKTTRERRKGVASVLLARVTAWATKDPLCAALYLHVIEYNQSAMDFYSKLGLIQFGRVADFYPIEGKNHDAFVYVLYMNGGEPPPPEPPGLMEKVWDWISRAITVVAVFAFGEEEEEPAKEDTSALSAKEEDLV